MIGGRFMIEKGVGDSWVPIRESVSVSVALSYGSDILRSFPHRITRTIDGEIVSMWNPDTNSWSPDPIARAELWQLTQPRIDDLRLHILARVPTVPIEHHVEAADLARRAIEVAMDGGEEVETTRDERRLLLSGESYFEGSPLPAVVDRLRLLGHLPDDHPLVLSAIEAMEGVTPMRNEGSAILYETDYDTKMGLVGAHILIADDLGMRRIDVSYNMLAGAVRERELTALRGILDREVDDHPGAICLTRKNMNLLEDHVATPPGTYQQIVVTGRTVFVGDAEDFPGFSILTSDGGRCDVQDANGSMVAKGVKDHLTARCIAINHCLSGSKGYVRGRR